MRQLQQRLSTAEACLAALTGIFRAQHRQNNSGPLPEWLSAYDQINPTVQTSTTSREVSPLPQAEPTPGRTIFSPRSQRPLNDPSQSTLRIDSDSNIPKTTPLIDQKAAEVLSMVTDDLVQGQIDPPRKGTSFVIHTFNPLITVYFLSRSS